MFNLITVIVSIFPALKAAKLDPIRHLSMSNLIKLSNLNKSFDNVKNIKVLKKFPSILKKERFTL